MKLGETTELFFEHIHRYIFYVLYRIFIEINLLECFSMHKMDYWMRTRPIDVPFAWLILANRGFHWNFDWKRRQRIKIGIDVASFAKFRCCTCHCWSELNLSATSLSSDIRIDHASNFCHRIHWLYSYGILSIVDAAIAENAFFWVFSRIFTYFGWSIKHARTWPCRGVKPDKSSFRKTTNRLWKFDRECPFQIF